jgi:outer membrane receptor for Fe3+-dicitrate
VQSASNLNSSRNNSQINDYDVRERISAGYIMATLKFGDFTLVPGVRIEHTADRAQAKLILPAPRRSTRDSTASTANPTPMPSPG